MFRFRDKIIKPRVLQFAVFICPCSGSIFELSHYLGLTMFKQDITITTTAASINYTGTMLETYYDKTGGSPLVYSTVSNKCDWFFRVIAQSVLYSMVSTKCMWSTLNTLKFFINVTIMKVMLRILILYFLKYQTVFHAISWSQAPILCWPFPHNYDFLFVCVCACVSVALGYRAWPRHPQWLPHYPSSPAIPISTWHFRQHHQTITRTCAWHLSRYRRKICLNLAHHTLNHSWPMKAKEAWIVLENSWKI